MRIGTAEIYRQVEQLNEVVEALVIGQDWDNDARVVLFVRLREGLELDDALTHTIRNAYPRGSHASARAGQGRASHRHSPDPQWQDRRASRS